MRSHLHLAHEIWKKNVNPGDLVIDATVGNGRDTAVLLDLVGDTGTVIGYEIQSDAAEAARSKFGDTIDVRNQCHSMISGSNAKLVVYNLGYLPGGDKELTTLLETTLLSVKRACALLTPGGIVSITCYPGHIEGAREEEALLYWARELQKSEWTVVHHQWINRYQAPSLLMLQRQNLRPIS